MKQLVIPALIALLIAGCSSTPDTAGGGAAVEDRNGGVATVNTDKVNGSKLPAELTDPKSILSKRSVYFDFDSYVVKNEYQSVVDAHSRYLNSHRNRKVIIQGNTDDRGGSEYNLALGQKRAEAVRKAMSLMGVSDDQMEAVSFGKEKPRATGNNEAAWAENRRADIVYQ